MTKQEAVERLMTTYGARYAKETTPPIVLTVGADGASEHDEELIWPAYEEELDFPALTTQGNLNRAPDHMCDVRVGAVWTTSTSSWSWDPALSRLGAGTGPPSYCTAR